MRLIRLAMFGLSAAVLFSATGCKKSYLETTPSDAITDENLYASTKGAYMVLDGMARLMTTTGSALSAAGATNRHNDFGAKAVDLGDDLMGNDVVCNSTNYDWFQDYYNYSGPARANYAVTVLPWAMYYKLINAANLLIANVDGAAGTEAERNDIKGQAYAYRAWAYYRLSIYYCKTYALGRSNPGVPIYTQPTTAANTGNPRGTVGDVYDRAVADIEEAVKLITLSGMSHSNKSYIGLATAQGIYAKIALVMNNWPKAAEMADASISTWGGDSKLMDTVAYKGGFVNGANPEFMWCSALIQPQTQAFGIISWISFVDHTNPGSYAGGGTTWRKITRDLHNKIANSDVRRRVFASDLKQTKFRMADASQWVYDNLYMRLSDIYLIKAEANAHIAGNETVAIETLETLIKMRNPEYDFATNAYVGSANLLEEIYLQRRIELFLEGQSLSDIVRLQKPLARPRNSGNHLAHAQVFELPANSNKFLFKIPQSEIDASSAMSASDQNPD